MGDLMPNNDSDAAIIHVEGAVLLEEDAIEEASRKDHRVLLRLVVGIHDGSPSMSLPALWISHFAELL